MRANTSDLYLKPTHYCDYDHPVIGDIAGRFAGRPGNRIELVKAIFEHVRDEIVFGMDLVQTLRHPVSTDTIWYEVRF